MIFFFKNTGKNYFLVQICNLEVKTRLLIPILPYFQKTIMVAHMAQNGPNGHFGPYRPPSVNVESIAIWVSKFLFLLVDYRSVQEKSFYHNF